MSHHQDPWSHGNEFIGIDVIIPPNTLLPCQMPSRRAPTPEAALLSDIYRDALWRLERSYRSPSPKNLTQRGEVFSWLYGDPADIPFELICEHFDIASELLRAAIIKWCREMEGGKFRNAVVRASPVNSANAIVVDAERRTALKMRQQRLGRVRAATEVQS